MHGASTFTSRTAGILPLTPIGRVTERVLRLNLAERVEIRETLAQTERYP